MRRLDDAASWESVPLSLGQGVKAGQCRNVELIAEPGTHIVLHIFLVRYIDAKRMRYLGRGLEAEHGIADRPAGALGPAPVPTPEQDHREQPIAKVALGQMMQIRHAVVRQLFMPPRQCVLSRAERILHAASIGPGPSLFARQGPVCNRALARGPAGAERVSPTPCAALRRVVHTPTIRCRP